MVPIISFVGGANSGKTTCLERFIPLLQRRGYRIGIVKHHNGDFIVDQPGKDTWRFYEAGAEAVAIAGPNKVAVMRVLPEELSLTEIGALMGDIDVLLAEGYKQGGQEKIEVVKPGCVPVMPAEALVAMIADKTYYDAVPTFGFAQLPEFAAFLEARWQQLPSAGEERTNA